MLELCWEKWKISQKNKGGGHPSSEQKSFELRGCETYTQSSSLNELPMVVICGHNTSNGLAKALNHSDQKIHICVNFSVKIL